MRIISGTRKGMRLQAPAGRAVRPTPDRVREALMSILGGRFDGERVLDLFAGTGAVGLECASRGCGELVLVERAAEALVALKDNVARFGSQPPISVMSVGMRRAIEVLADRGARFDLIYLDPPYGHGLELEALERLLKHGLLAPAGQVWVETETEIVDAPESLRRVDHRRYGRVHLHGFEEASRDA